MGYRYETHLHTAQGSLCGKSTGAQQARFYRQCGYRGIIVTDHFTGGNTAMPRQGSWKDRVDAFCRGYEDARAVGEKIGLDVFFGWEECFSYDGGRDEYLVYGLDKQWLYEHPRIEEWDRQTYYKAVRESGGCMIQAHPFRERDYIGEVRLGLPFCDGVEAANLFNEPGADACAMRYARAYGLPVIAGSDNHLANRPGWTELGMTYGIELDKPLADLSQLVSLIRNREPIGLIVPQGRFAPDPAYGVSLPVYLLEKDGGMTLDHRDWTK